MTYFYLIIKIIIILALDLCGIVGAISPAIPGPPLCLIALVITYYCFPGAISLTFLLIMLGLCLVAVVIDYFAPILVTKFGGGSKWAIWGSTIGLFVGFFFPPLGIIWVPLVGAFVGELIANFKLGKAFKVALLSFISFLLTVGFKLILCGVISVASVIPCFVK